MEVNVDIKSVQLQIKVLKESLNRVNILYKELGSNFQDMQSWNDAKSQEAKAIVASCGKDIQKMGKSINQAIVNLEKILKPLIEYENTNLYSAGTSNSGINASNINSGLDSRAASGRVVHSVNDLSKDEKAAVTIYTGDDYKNINDSLRGKDTATPQNAQVIDTLTNALQESELSENMTLYRGTSIMALGSELMNLSPEELVGESFTERGFTSTSTDDYMARYFATNYNYNSRPMIMTIDARVGDHALNVTPISQHPSEQEILFNRDTSFTITSATVVDGVLNITVRPERS